MLAHPRPVLPGQSCRGCGTPWAERARHLAGLRTRARQGCEGWGRSPPGGVRGRWGLPPRTNAGGMTPLHGLGGPCKPSHGLAGPPTKKPSRRRRAARPVGLSCPSSPGVASGHESSHHPGGARPTRCRCWHRVASYSARCQSQHPYPCAVPDLRLRVGCIPEPCAAGRRVPEVRRQRADHTRGAPRASRCRWH